MRGKNGIDFETSIEHPPSHYPDRLYLTNVSGLPGFRALYDALSMMGFYNLNPAQIREVQSPDPGGVLARDGRNTASVLGRVQATSPGDAHQIADFLKAIVPDIRGVERVSVANKETLEFRQRVKGSPHPWRFYANCMSDGTLRALGVLVALFQNTDKMHRVPLIGIEEPESALHPAALGILLDALQAASTSTQIIVTSHSPTLLDVDSIDQRQLLAVRATDGVASIGPLTPASLSALKNQLATAGELLAQGMLEPDETSSSREAGELDLFTPLD